MQFTFMAALCVATAVAAMPPGAQGQPAPLTLTAAIEEARARNPQILALRAQLDADRLRPQQERSLMPPMFEAEIWQWPLNRANPAAAIYMFSAQQDFPGRGKREARARTAEAALAVSAAEIPVRIRDIVNDLQRTYAELFVARKAIEINIETIALLRQIADATQIRYAAGRTPQQDVLKAVLEISRLHEEQLTLREGARTAEARLNTLLGRDASLPVTDLAEPVETAATPALETLQRAALDRQPELALARADIARAEAAETAARSDRRPDFFVRGGYMLMPGEAGAFAASVGVTWPNAPWSRRRFDAASQQARLDAGAARARYDAAVSAIRLMVQEAHVRLQSAAERAALLRTSVVPQSAQALDVSRVGYQADRGAFLDIVDNQRMLADARLGYYRALADLEQARADLERAVGAPLAVLAQPGGGS